MAKTFIPHEYQDPAIDFICELPRCGLLAPMGGGKTIVTLTALERLDATRPVYPALVLAPLRVANATWPLEVHKWAHTEHLRVTPIAGRRNPEVSATAKERLKALSTPSDVYTLPYDGLKWLVETMGSGWPFRTVVADELTRLKSFRIRQGGANAGALGRVAFGPVERFIGLTGTPASNGVKDMWGPTWFLDKGQRLGRTFSAFEQRWFEKGWDGFSLQPMAHAQEEIQELIRDIYLTVEGLPVDDVIENIIEVDLPPKARALYNDMERDAFATIERDGVYGVAKSLDDDVDVEAVNGAVKVNKCIQIANGVLFHENGWEHVHNAKIEALESVVTEANGANLLVSYTLVPVSELVRRHFRQARMLDANPDTQRQWNAGRISLLLAHPASAGHGLNLQDGGNTLVDMGVTWNLEHDQQIIERIGPLRQKQAGYDRPVYRHRIVAKDTFEDLVMLPRQKSKESVQQALVNAMRRRKA